MTAQDILEAGVGLLILAAQWLWAHVWTVVAVVFGFAALYQLSELRRTAMVLSLRLDALGTEVTELGETIEDLKETIDELKFEVELAEDE